MCNLQAQRRETRKLKDVAIIKPSFLEEGSAGFIVYSQHTGRPIVCSSHKRLICKWLMRRGYSRKRRKWDWNDVIVLAPPKDLKWSSLQEFRDSYLRA